MKAARDLLEDCCGWNKKTWADAVAFALSQLPSSIEGKKVLEIGAGQYSCLAPAFAGTGALVVCSYYGKQASEIENGQLGLIRQKYHVHDIRVLEVDIHDVPRGYDVIIMKSVLGGICRHNNYEKVKSVVDRLMKSMAPGGILLTVDNGYIRPFAPLRSVWGAGRNYWTYFSKDALISVLSDYDVVIRGFGLLSCGSIGRAHPFVTDLLTDLLYQLDKILLKMFPLPRARAVLATAIQQKKNEVSHR